MSSSTFSYLAALPPMRYLFPLLAAFVLLQTAFAGTARRPNILFILVDDQSPFDLRIYHPASPLHYLPAHPFPHGHPGLRDEETVRDVVYGVYSGGTKPGMRSVKQGDWKLVKFDVLDGTVRETQLFNLKENPHEFLVQHHDPADVALTGVKPAPHQRNLADDPAHAATLARMEALLLAEMRRLNDPGRLWNQPADGRAPATKGGSSPQAPKKPKV